MVVREFETLKEAEKAECAENGKSRSNFELRIMNYE